MTVSALSAAKAVCEASDWTISNLALQKILYIANMIYTGHHKGQPMISERFEAWDYGPVVPVVYHRVKAFGRDPVGNVFHTVPDLPPGPEATALKDAAKNLSKMSPSKLVAITHWDDGAWSKHYTPGMNRIIPTADISQEYQTRFTAQ